MSQRLIKSMVHKQDRIMTFDKPPDTMGDGAWVTRHHKAVEDLDLDILLYIGMSNYCCLLML